MGRNNEHLQGRGAGGASIGEVEGASEETPCLWEYGAFPLLQAPNSEAAREGEKGEATRVHILLFCWDGCAQTNKQKGAHAREQDMSEAQGQWELGRFLPEVSFLGQELAQGRLSTASFPHIGEGAGGGSGTGKSVRSTGWWTRKGESQEAKRHKRKLFVFIVGGATYSEVRSTFELSESSERDPLLGSSSILTPSSFFSKLSATS